MDIYDELVQRGLVRSHRGYSRLMGMADNYFCSNRETGVSYQALFNLHERLIEIKQFDLAERVVEIVFGPDARSSGRTR